MIARNRATDFHRQAVDAVELPEDLSAPESSSARAEALAALEVIRTLPEAYRETLVLRLVEGLTGPEIADRTGLTPASVRVNLHRGMGLLRAKLGRDRQSSRAMKKTEDEEHAYLWDGSGEPDPEVVRLETLLGQLRHRGVPPRVAARRTPTVRRRAPGTWVVVGALAAAAVVVLLVNVGWRVMGSLGRAWNVQTIAGTPIVDGVEREPARRRRRHDSAPEDGSKPTRCRVRASTWARSVGSMSSPTHACRWLRRAGASIACRWREEPSTRASGRRRRCFL